MSAADNKAVLGAALTEIRELRTALERSAHRADEPVAIVGMACRLPDADSPAAFWDLLRTGRDATRDIPADRWDPAGFPPVRRAGLLDEIDTFDAGFFGVSAREATRMDPQQRLFLEVAWEALENAGQAPDGLAESRTGVFLGVTGSEYIQAMLKECPPTDIDAYWLTGGMTSPFAAGRLSYWLGLRGPSLTLDTACSASLVAVHLACQSLRTGECSTALAGGVNVMVTSDWFVAMSKANMLAPDGQCKTFSDAADGYARGEGCGVVVLKLLSEATANGDRVLAVIRGSAVNQDGRSGGITVPNGQAQQAVIRDALRAAGVRGAQVGYVEAHGTGTPLGDPIEVHALSSVLCADRDPDRPLPIGTVKTNMGHLESAAGIAGLIKTVLSLRHRQLPPLLHLSTVNPRIPLGELGVTIPTELTDWARLEGTRIAGVSSFGASGTNAHLILEESSDPPAAGSAAGGTHLVSLSARSDEALRALIARYRDHLDATDSLADVAHTANNGRARFGHRAVVLADSTEAARAALAAHAEGTPHQDVRTGVVPPGARPKVAFLFSGQGSQYPGMGRALYRSQPSFQADLDRCDAILGGELLPVLFDEHTPLDQTRHAQPALFSLQYALARLWRRWGVAPAALLGHSVGEYAAACVAGVFDLADGLALIAERGRLMQELPEGGGMVAVLAGPGHVERALAPYEGRLCVAAVNGPDNVVVSGPNAVLDELIKALKAEGVRSARLRVSHAFHSSLVEPALERFEQRAAQVSFADPRIPLVSNLTGQVAEAGTFSAGYLRDHARQPVRFAAGVEQLVSRGCTVFLEIGPAATLCTLAGKIVEPGRVTLLSSLNRDGEDERTMLASLGELFVRGVKVDWRGVDEHRPRRVVDLPTYAFERHRHWFEPTTRPVLAPVVAGPGAPASATLLGERVPSPVDAVQFRSLLSVDRHPCLGDCVCAGAAVVNAGCYVEAVLAAVAQLRGFERTRIEDLSLPQAFLMPEEGVRTAMLVVDPAVGGRTPFRYYSQPEPDGVWALHAQGAFAAEPGQAPAIGTDGVEDISRRCTTTLSGAEFYRALWKRKIYLGSSARWITHLRCGKGEVLARLRAPEPGEADDYLLHPGFTDSVLQLVFACVYDTLPLATMLILTGLERFSRHGHCDEPLLCHALVRAESGSAVTGDLRVLTEDGTCLLELTGVSMRKTSQDAILAAGRAQPAPTAITAEGSALRAAFQTGQDDEAGRRLHELLLEQVAAVLGGTGSRPAPTEPLQNLGLDSLLAVELRDAVAGALGISLPLAMFLDNPTVASLVATVRPLLHPGTATPVERTEVTGPGGMHVVELGRGTPILFVHGGAVCGEQAWLTQASLADRWRLVMPSRLNYGRSATSEREDFEVDAKLIAELLGDGAHLVAQSYGTVGALLAAAQRPDAVLSLTLIESAASGVARGTPVVDEFEQAMRALLARPPAADDALFRAIFALIDPGTPYPDVLSGGQRTTASLARDRVRWPWEAELPLDRLRAAAIPTLVVSGGQRPVFEAISDALAARLDGRRLVIPGGHATQNVGSAFNAALEEFLTRGAGNGPA
ncbi:type I polyketide synthase [Frankia sp. Cj3]|uniref:type I polyketide synthase n=1 Tax=Frankia sp. Cj3 TaxID=2880976 RepID=UPI001EF412CD|nr:type I polyketide synthase [Frankia sp. Cj3]